MDRDLLSQTAAAFQLTLSDRQLEQFQEYEDFLYEANATQNLTRIPRERATLEHFLDSLSAAPYLGKAKSIADVGSGAGFPGLALAIALPEIPVTLIEPIKKRAWFLRQTSESLGLTNVSIATERAEVLGRVVFRGEFGGVTARAVAELPILTELSLPLLAPGGQAVYLKGPEADREVEAAAPALKELDASLTGVYDPGLPGLQRRLVVVKKEGRTEQRYPRTYQAIERKPLGT